MRTSVLLVMGPGAPRTALCAWLGELGLAVTATSSAVRALDALGGYLRPPAAVLLDLPVAEVGVFLRGMHAAVWCHAVPAVTSALDGAALRESGLRILCVPAPWTPVALRRVLASVPARPVATGIGGQAIGRLSRAR
jgi:hypothetical protein